MNRARQLIALRILGLFYIALILGGLSLHFWTVKMVHYVEGRGWIVAFMFPVGAEIYWAISSGARSDSRTFTRSRSWHTASSA